MTKASNRIVEPIRPYFKFYPRHYELLQLVPVEERGAVYDAIAEASLYDKWPNMEQLSPSGQIVFREFSHSIQTSVQNHKNAKSKTRKEEAVDTETGEEFTPSASAPANSETTSEEASEEASETRTETEAKTAPRERPFYNPNNDHFIDPSTEQEMDDNDPTIPF